MARFAVAAFVIVVFALPRGEVYAEERDVSSPPHEAAQLPLNVCLVPEMGYIAELQVWKFCRSDAHAEHAKKLGELWPKEAKELQPIVTPDLARRLSRWSQKQMEDYDRSPALEKVKLMPVAVNMDERLGKPRHLVFRGVVDTLPTHHSLVTRWLEVYVVYSVPGESILRTTITIRGQRLE
jgi:hypothetical protein